MHSLAKLTRESEGFVTDCGEGPVSPVEEKVPMFFVPDHWLFRTFSLRFCLQDGPLLGSFVQITFLLFINVPRLLNINFGGTKLDKLSPKQCFSISNTVECIS